MSSQQQGGRGSGKPIQNKGRGQNGTHSSSHTTYYIQAGKPTQSSFGRGIGRGSAITSAFRVDPTTTQEIGKMTGDITKLKSQEVSF